MAEPDGPDTSGDRGPHDRLLVGSGHLSPARRSPLLEYFTRVLHPTVMVVAAYLFLVGLHHPGGGFAAGLVVGLGLLLRRIAGGPHELGAAGRFPPGVLLGSGLVLAAGYGIVGLVIKGDLLTGTVLHVDLPGIPAHALASSMIFEAGIALIVVGLALDLLRTLGEEAEE